MLFKKSLMCAPMEDKLEDFYIALGSPTLESLVQDELRLGHPAEKQESAVKLRGHILERSKLLLHECSRENIKHDSRWLDKNLNVQVVSSVSLTRSLRGTSLRSTDKRSAAVANEKHKGWTLYITAGSWDTYQISQAVCKLLLERPSQQSYLSFETLLNLNLLQLRNRGYNVERILRAKAAEQRIAEEERKKQLEIEQAQIKQQEQQWQQQALPVPVVREERHSQQMPGAFGSDSPPPAEEKRRETRGLFSNITRRLGINTNSDAQEQMQNMIGGSREPQSDNPPTYDEANKGTVTKKGGTEQVSSPAAVQQNLLNAIQSCRAHNSSSVFSPPRAEEIKEQASYCDSASGQNIMFLADASNGTRIFISKDIPQPAQTTFLSQSVPALNTFAALLYDIADIYTMSRKAIHVFYDESGPSIAFNLNGSIFCNFRYYKQLHQRKMEVQDPQGKVEAAAYWYVTVAHELAHNLVQEHSQAHSFNT